MISCQRPSPLAHWPFALSLPYPASRRPRFSSKGFVKITQRQEESHCENYSLPPLRSPTRYFWNGASTFSISAWAFFIPSSGVYFSSKISWKVVTKMFRIFQLSCVLISGKA